MSAWIKALHVDYHLYVCQSRESGAAIRYRLQEERVVEEVEPLHDLVNRGETSLARIQEYSADDRFEGGGHHLGGYPARSWIFDDTGVKSQ